jgi:hypothetical protein
MPFVSLCGASVTAAWTAIAVINKTTALQNNVNLLITNPRLFICSPPFVVFSISATTAIIHQNLQTAENQTIPGDRYS